MRQELVDSTHKTYQQKSNVVIVVPTSENDTICITCDPIHTNSCACTIKGWNYKNEVSNSNSKSVREKRTCCGVGIVNCF